MGCAASARQPMTGTAPRGERARRLLLFLALCLLPWLTVSGCVQPKRNIQTRPPWYGPTESMSEVVSQINRNNRAITSLWAAHDFEADILDDQGRSHFVNGDGTLLFARPFNVRLLGDKPVVGRVFDIGANADRYWLLLPEQVRTMWWGWFEHVGKPCVQELPIRPDLLLEVLGIGEIGPDLLAEPAPVMRFNNDAHAYMFIWVFAAPDRLIAQKEVWYDRETKLPRLVLLFDSDGRILLRAYLSEHAPVESPGVPRENWPQVATRYELFFPQPGRTPDQAGPVGSTLRFTLRNPALSRRGFPRPASFSFPDNPPIPRENVIQVDANCTD